jgi:hypothetical protein
MHSEKNILHFQYEKTYICVWGKYIGQCHLGEKYEKGNEKREKCKRKRKKGERTRKIGERKRVIGK